MEIKNLSNSFVPDKLKSLSIADVVDFICSDVFRYVKEA